MLDGRIILLIIFGISFIGMTSIIIDMLITSEADDRKVMKIVKKPKEPVVSEDFDLEVDSDLLEP